MKASPSSMGDEAKQPSCSQLKFSCCRSGSPANLRTEWSTTAPTAELSRVSPSSHWQMRERSARPVCVIPKWRRQAHAPETAPPCPTSRRTAGLSSERDMAGVRACGRVNRDFCPSRVQLASGSSPSASHCGGCDVRLPFVKPRSGTSAPQVGEQFRISASRYACT